MSPWCSQAAVLVWTNSGFLGTALGSAQLTSASQFNWSTSHTAYIELPSMLKLLYAPIAY